jgi:hypothetical protein
MTKPPSLNPLADEILKRLSTYPEASEIVLGGYFALQHYADYRLTRDIDAWWHTRASRPAEDAIRRVMTEVASDHGLELRERSLGDTLSFELWRGAGKEFSFQIAVRTVGLDRPMSSPWPPIQIETLHDNIGSKMNALVNRGAPRDLMDIKHVVDERLVSVDDCWSLWSRKNPAQSIPGGKRRVLLHLDMLEARRPLHGIIDPAERMRADELRNWYRREFLTNDVH